MIDLAAALPLDRPMTVLADFSGACNFRCRFCPTGDHELLRSVGRKAGLMDFELWERIVGQLGEFKSPVKSLLCWKDGEPTLHPRMADMIAVAKWAGVAERIETTTNGALLVREKSAALIDAGLDHIRISVEHVTDEGYRRIAQTRTGYGQILSNARMFREERDARASKCTIHVKIVDTGLTVEEKEKFYDDFAPIADTLNIDAPFAWPAVDTLIGQVPTTGIDGVTPLKAAREVCPAPFKGMAIEWTGRVVACCVDWAGATALGDVNTESLREIWEGSRMRAFRMMHLEGRRCENGACKDCGYLAGYNAESDLDADRERLLKVYA